MGFDVTKIFNMDWDKEVYELFQIFTIQLSGSSGRHS